MKALKGLSDFVECRRVRIRVTGHPDLCKSLRTLEGGTDDMGHICPRSDKTCASSLPLMPHAPLLTDDSTQKPLMM